MIPEHVYISYRHWGFLFVLRCCLVGPFAFAYLSVFQAVATMGSPEPHSALGFAMRASLA